MGGTIRWVQTFIRLVQGDETVGAGLLAFGTTRYARHTTLV
ncbi:hypothetical protein SAMN04490194_2571 [Pseudomonas migulae]|uniref:Uncharacterized protein n=1 Tax=Pseudomonas migulae TaxID=78543 RepID=A0A1H5JHV1_9PSED|nr:hypothetical protein FBY04_10798 [Pseudomonas sp. SJZ080]SEE51571.1 hypothetical protein SAMN04490194_2571 [Pseudomonas migulae]